MSAQPIPASPRRAGSYTTLWRPMAKVTWLQHRAAVATGVALFTGITLVIIRNSLAPRATFARLAASGCLGRPGRASCPGLLNSLATHTGSLSLVTIMLVVIPALTGTFIGAPALAREIESGTYRFAWTQEIGRARWLAGKIVLLGAASVAAACALGFLATWSATPFESAGLASRWQAGQFAGTGLILTVWTLFSLTAGMLAGLLIARLVAAMAAAAAFVGGLTLLDFWRLHDYVMAITPRITQAPPIGPGSGALNASAASLGKGPPGSWLVSQWFTGPGGNPLPATTASNLLGRIAANTQGVARKADPGP